MDIESVIEQLELAISLIDQSGKDWLDERDIPILEKAIEVCKKEVPKKPIKHEPIDLALFYRCPSCDNCLIDNSPHCIVCGQKIDWGEEDE